MKFDEIKLNSRYNINSENIVVNVIKNVPPNDVLTRPIYHIVQKKFES